MSKNVNLSVPEELTDGVVCLRPFTESDVPQLVQFLSDPEIQDRNRVPEATEDAVNTWLLEGAAETQAGRSILFAICDAKTKDLAGRIGIWFEHEHSRAVIGYWVAAPARGRRLATKATLLVARWAFDEGLVGRLGASCDLDNVASIKTLEAAGFQPEGTLRAYTLTGKGERRDQYSFGLLRSDPA